jgi:hypothetical protein
MRSKYNASPTKSQTESKQISIYSLQQSATTSVMCSLANSPIEKGLALLAEDLLFGNETQIAQINLGEMAGVGRQCMNESLAVLKDLGLLTWRRVRYGANIYTLPPIYSDPKFLKLLGKLLPRFKRICDKLLARTKSMDSKLSTSQATPSNIEDVSLSSPRVICNITELLGKDKETGDIVKEPAEEKKPNLTADEKERLRILKAKAPKGSAWEAFYLTLDL